MAALFLDAVFLSVRPEGPKEGVLVAWGFTEEGERVLLGVMLGCASPTRTGVREQLELLDRRQALQRGLTDRVARHRPASLTLSSGLSGA